MTHQTRAHKSHVETVSPLPLPAELRRLALVYEDYPGIANDLLLALADLKRRTACNEAVAS